jgi:hypothetical protein
LVCGSLVSMAAGAKSDLSPLSLLALHLLACSLCVGYALVRRKLLGKETHTLLEIIAVALMVGLVVTRAAQLPALAYLDATMVGTCVLIAIGRFGCFSVGCCYGVEADIGIVYPHECGGDGKTRRLPVQLMDAAIWTLLARVCWGLVGIVAPGMVLAVVLLGYGVSRYALEFLRGDRRPHWRGRSLSQWLSLVAIVGGGVLGQQIKSWTIGVSLLLAAGLAAWVVMARVGSRWLLPEPSLDHLGELDSLVSDWSATRPRQIVVRQVGAYRIGGLCTETTEIWSLSLSASEAECTFAEARLVLGALAKRLDCVTEGATIRRSAAGVYLWQQGKSPLSG